MMDQRNPQQKEEEKQKEEVKKQESSKKDDDETRHVEVGMTEEEKQELQKKKVERDKLLRKKRQLKKQGKDTTYIDEVIQKEGTIEDYKPVEERRKLLKKKIEQTEDRIVDEDELKHNTTSLEKLLEEEKNLQENKNKLLAERKRQWRRELEANLRGVLKIDFKDLGSGTDDAWFIDESPLGSDTIPERLQLRTILKGFF
jgi:hypothetical protein